MKRRLKLAHPVEDGLGRQDGYEVIEVGNSVDFSPGQVLTMRRVQELCDHSLFEVTIVAKRKEREVK